ncbi:hypothetical protein DDZ14_14415 [Maritimibacter sp. 55A14]|uniref:hypothetical protein n=1 Tax=Maritimibacter sp. 55A14 TaxID=2174844 RepID=UPI000D60AD74|nr:hypothetical protein [Maritimibacter sp. 55A14]PWE30626.1 hypothetical protein DDZ14_14415 [Maritimibacter sp. 55A14]
MSRRAEHALLLEQRNYRRRRLHDAAFLLPVLAVLLFLLPLMGFRAEDGSEGVVSTRAAGIYFFAAWALLVLAAGVLSVRLVRGGGDERPAGGGDGG